MRPLNNILITLSDQTIGHTFQKMKSGLLIDFTYNPQDWVPSYGIVQESCSPEIKKGDTAYVDYHSVLSSLGIRYNSGQTQLLDKKYIEEDGIISVFISPNNVFFVMRDNEIIPVNGNELIEPIFEEKSTSLVAGRQMTAMCHVLTGEYKGKKMVFRKQRMRNCGQYGFNAKEFYIINKDYLLAEVEDGQ